MKRLLTTLISCFVLLSATLSAPALAEAKDEIEQSDKSVVQDVLTEAACGVQAVFDGAKTQIADLFSTSEFLALNESESAQASARATSQDAVSAAAIPSNLDGVVWSPDYTTCTLQSGHSVDGQALRAEIDLHRSTLTTFVAEDNTSLTGSAAMLFEECTSLGTVNLAPSFNTGAVTNMTRMFYNCWSLASLTLPNGFDTGAVENMSSMFYNCSGLTSLTLPNTFSTGAVENMSSMFYKCKKLPSLTLPDAFDTGGVETMQYMFYECKKLASLTLPDTFDTSSVKNMSAMFSGCELLASLTLPDAFDTGAVTDMTSMFYGCSKLTSLTLPDVFNTSEVKNMPAMFMDCKKLASLNLSHFATNNQLNGPNMFVGCSELGALTLPKAFTMKTGMGLPHLNNSTSPFWISSIQNAVSYNTPEADAVSNINAVLAALPDGATQTFTKAALRLTYDANGGQFGNTAPGVRESHLYGNKDDLISGRDASGRPFNYTPIPTKTGYVCAGYADSQTATTPNAPDKFPAAAATYYAVWGTAIPITFNANGHGSFAGDAGTLAIDSALGGKLTLPAEDALTVEPGYAFNGWFSAASGGIQVTDQTDCPATATTYYAQYSVAPGPTPEPTPDVVPASDVDALPLTSDTSAGRSFVVFAVITGALALLASGDSLCRKRSF